jgi:beta-galactosidase
MRFTNLSLFVGRPVALLSSVALLCLTIWGQPKPAPGAPFDPAQMKTVLYGAAFYEEYMPYERLDKDVELMQQAGISVVRVGESTWSLWEPQDGHFDYAWMDRIIERLHRAGIQVVLGTPTYSIPVWMYKEHPEILVTKLGGEKATYGLRQNMDISNPAFRFYSERVIRKICEHYKDNPAVIGYQLDNETGPYGTAGPAVQANFVKYLQEKFGTVERLNKVWGLVYWGQNLNDWTELPPRDGILNPGWKLEFERYQQSLVTDFLGFQANIVNQYKRPDQFVTQDFAGATRPDVNEHAVAKHLDIAAVNPYHPTQDNYDGVSSSYAGDYTRSLKQTNFLVTETNAQTIGWDSTSQMPPYDGQLRMDVYAYASTGANMVEYWHWHSLHYGQETYWKGVLSHDLEPGRAYAEVSKTAHELQRIGTHLVDFKPSNKVAILYSNDSRHGIEYMPYRRPQPNPHMPFGGMDGYDVVIRQMYQSLYRLNAGVDFVFPETTDLSQYKVVVVPALYIASDELLKRLADYVRNGGHVVMTFKSGFCNEYSTVRWEMAPGPLREAAGFHYQEFSSLEKPLTLKGDPFGVGAANQVSDWAEMIITDKARTLATYDHPFFGKYPAVTENQFGAGTLTYEGTLVSDALQEKILARVMGAAGLTGPDQALPASVRVRHGQNRLGQTLHYYFNYSQDDRSVTYAYGPGTELLGQKSLAKGASIALGPWDVAIVEENQ